MKAKRRFPRSAARLFAVVSAACAAVLLIPPAAAQPTRDFGDAPDPYPTLLKDDGANHPVGSLRLGFLVDAEFDGLPSAFALGDDLDLDDDEDGIAFVSALVPGQNALVEVTVSGAPNGARLDAWIDFEDNGSWDDLPDHIFAGQFVTNGVNSLAFAVPAATKLGPTFARFRLSLVGDLTPRGAAQDGEVEDYRVGISQAMDFSDAPVSFGTVGGFNYPTLLSQNGARHQILDNFWLGSNIDSEPDGQPNASATGDDANPPGTPDDEDGVLFLSTLVAGQTALVEVMGTMGANMTGLLNAWIDYNRDGDWDDAGEQIFKDQAIVAGINPLNFTVPGSAAGGTTFARFRLNLQGKLTPRGFASEGEVEDYQVDVTAAQDYGDAPNTSDIGGNYPTLLAENGARHNFQPDFCLGEIVDGETDGQPKPDALGDDLNPPNAADDEDGVSFTSSIVPGQTASIEIRVKLPAGVNQAYVNAWMDYNRDGDWADSGEQIFLALPVSAGVNTPPFTVPAGASPGATFARFRLSSSRSLTYTGLADDGEVEDYEVNINDNNLDFGDAPRPYPTLLAANGARHTRNPDVFLGFAIDTEPDGQPDAAALGDDLVGDDEDGVTFTSPLVPGASATVQVRASTPGVLHAWMDFDGNASWAEAGEKIFNGVSLSSGVNNLSFTVPATAKTGTTFARFRFTLQSANLSYVGAAADGEVEDYRVSIIPDRDRCDLACEGLDFWLTFPGNYAPDPANPVRAELCIMGPANVTASVAIPGLGFTTNVIIPASMNVHVPLPEEADLGDLNDGITNRGIHVTATGYVSVHAFNQVFYTTDSYLGLPSSVLGTEYVLLGYGNVQTGVPTLNGSQFAITACESNTTVTITPSVDTGARSAGVPYNLVLQPGDCYQLRNTDDAPADLTGTIIKSDKPVAVFGSHQHPNIPSNSVWFWDYIVEQLLPVNAWGNTFYTAPLATRTGGDTFRCLAAQDNTTVFVNGASIGTIDRGKFLQFNLTAGAQIIADKPVLVAQYANSSDYDLVTDSDPFMSLVPATRHYAFSYEFCTPETGFSANFVNVIAPSASIAGIFLDGAAIPGPFTPIGATGFSYAQVAVTSGAHALTGGALFTASVYGWAEYESYGHPACLHFGDLSVPTVNPSTTGTTASTADYPNTPGFVPTPDFASTAAPQDNCSPDLPRPTQVPREGTLLPVGVNTVTLSVVDNAGNIGYTNVTVTVVDPSPVIIDCPSNIVVGCTSSNGAVVDFMVTAHTTYESNVTVVSIPPSGSLFPPGTTLVESTATSLAGNTNSCSFTVTVVCETELSISLSSGGTEISLNWTGPSGTLEAAPTVLGPWMVITGTVNSVTLPVSTSSNMFFRIRH